MNLLGFKAIKTTVATVPNKTIIMKAVKNPIHIFFDVDEVLFSRSLLVLFDSKEVSSGFKLSALGIAYGQYGVILFISSVLFSISISKPLVWN